VRFLAITSNDAERYPADAPERMAQFVRDHDWPIPYAYDASQEVARALGAERTPHVFVLDGEQRLAYRGAPDADHQDPSQNAAWLRAALDAVLAGRQVERAETPARGCSVKWR
jgi:Redoxin